MPTTNQLVRNGRKKKKRKNKTPHLNGAPFRKGVVIKAGVLSPKKPNSADRKCARVRFPDGTEAWCYIPAEGHNVQEHSSVLVKGGGPADLPGVRYRLVRGAKGYDLATVDHRRNGRSKVGRKRPESDK